MFQLKIFDVAIIEIEMNIRSIKYKNRIISYIFYDIEHTCILKKKIEHKNYLPFLTSIIGIADYANYRIKYRIYNILYLNIE
jgi:hypothetical protein